MSRPSAHARQLRLVSCGEMTVKVTRPIDPPLPSGFIYGWSTTKLDGRQTFYLDLRPAQAVRVSYEVLEDPLQLEDLKARARRNKSGTAVRGYAAATRSEVRHDLTIRIIEALVRRAANNDTHRMVEGPATVKVKLLEQPAGTPPTCSHCKRTLAQHEVFQDTTLGDWGEWKDAGYTDGRGRARQTREWDPQKPRVNTFYLCPQEAQP
jgi:hypothetical protein